jgi:hypothetical protein
MTQVQVPPAALFVQNPGIGHDPVAWTVPERHEPSNRQLRSGLASRFAGVRKRQLTGAPIRKVSLSLGICC